MTKHLITSALPYINGVKHLGNLAGSLLPADVYARFLRQEGEEVLFICATDEHGTPAELAALEAGLSVQDYCDVMHKSQAEIYGEFGLSFDHFGRSSSLQNQELTQHFYQQLDNNGFLCERTIQQVYAVEDQRFLPDRYVTGTCPKCGNESARGDQCEQCTTVLDSTDLIEPRSALSGSTELEVRSTVHLFLRLDVLSNEIRNWVESHQAEWPRLTTSIALKWLDEGLKERCITRDLEWGVSVPRPGFNGKVFYVWFDAPIEYIGATAEWADLDPVQRDWKSWWYDAPDVRYTQFMAKDNVPFHAVFWPAMIIGSREPWLSATYIKSFNWLTYYGKKFSTSQKYGVFLDDALAVRAADEWRYFLLAQSPESDDSSFTWTLFASVVNKDLVGNFGNFVNRILKLTHAKFGAQIPGGGEPSQIEHQLMEDCTQIINTYRKHLRQTEYRKAVQSLRELWSLGNSYIDGRAPWTLVKENSEAAAMVLRTSIHLIRLFAAAAAFIIPFSSGKVFDALQLSNEERAATLLELTSLSGLDAGRPFTVPAHLFTRFDAEEIRALEDRFGCVR